MLYARGDMYFDYPVVRTKKKRNTIPRTNYPLYVANGGRIGYNEGDLVAPEQDLDDNTKC